jgi:hypothetical protein
LPALTLPFKDLVDAPSEEPTMPDESYDILRRALLEALGSRPTPERRRQVAADLRALAEQQERMAARNDQPSDAPARRPERAPESAGQTAGMYIRVSHEPDRQTGERRVRLSIGRQIWYDLGSPERITVQRAGAEIWIEPTTARTGYLLQSGSLPTCIVTGSDPLARVAPGRYAASIRAGAIVVGQRVA